MSFTFLTRSELQVCAKSICDPHTLGVVASLKKLNLPVPQSSTFLKGSDFVAYTPADTPQIVLKLHQSFIDAYATAYGVGLMNALNVEAVLAEETKTHEVLDLKTACYKIETLLNLGELESSKDIDFTFLQLFEHIKMCYDDIVDGLISADDMLEDHDEFHDLFDNASTHTSTCPLIVERKIELAIQKHMADGHECDPECVAEFVDELDLDL